MVVKSKKACDICGRVVAIRHSILYHTINPYVIFRHDDPVTYANNEEHTTKSKMHACDDCWDDIEMTLKAKLRK